MIEKRALPVLNYKEFKHPMEDRLTDEKWREMLITNPPEDPEWNKNFTAYCDVFLELMEIMDANLKYGNGMLLFKGV